MFVWVYLHLRARPVPDAIDLTMFLAPFYVLLGPEDEFIDIAITIWKPVWG